LPGNAHAEVDADHPLIEDTGYTLKRHEFKVGLFESSFGITDRLQIDSYLFADLVTFLNLGFKYKFLDLPNLAVAGEVWGGVLGIAVIGGIGFFDWGAQVDATVPLTERLNLNLSTGYRYWRFAEVAGLGGALLIDGRVSWPSVKAELQYGVTSNHIVFLTVGTQTAWQASVGGSGNQEFDATNFWSLTAGYQLSYKWFNGRIDLGYGPSILGRGITGDFDLYFRI
jgi:hypothetical protein